MCGIVGLVNLHAVAGDLLAALARLQYRGYDSAGLAVAGPGFALRKVVGRAAALGATLDASFAGRAGIAHIRWATHGRAEARNAHPHLWDGVAVVHNGIIENHAALRAALAAEGHAFASDTDSEVIPHLIAASRARGAGAAAVASDPAALAGFCEEYAALEDGDIAELSGAQVRIADRHGRAARRDWQALTPAEDAAEAGVFASHTRAEIAATPEALRRTGAALTGRRLPGGIVAAERLVMVACGSSLYAAATARPWIEQLTGVPCDLEIASEYRTRAAPIVRGSVAVLVSQSGETADTLAVQALFRQRGVPVVAVVNVAHSQMARAADLVWPTTAGRELGVAATKSFSCQLLALVRFGLALAQARASAPPAVLTEVEWELTSLPAVCAAAERLEPQLTAIARRIAAAYEAIFIGRGPAAALAAEGALKLKELSYIRADAYAAGELEHGPIALIQDRSPVIVCGGPNDDKTLANAEEVRARGAHVVALLGEDSAAAFAGVAHEVVVLPGQGLGLAFAQAVALQLLAVHAAEALGRDVDRPRNLAKSVTVE